MLKIFNTINNKKELFVPNTNKKVNLYVCGITPYDFCHLGHARTFIIFDVVFRFLKDLGYKVKYIRNITDVDDKIIQRSLKNKESIYTLTSRIIKQTNLDFSRLNLLKPYKEPLVTEHISEIINMIRVLIYKKYAYCSENGDILFSVKKNFNYGILSNQELKNLKFNSNKNILKKDKYDFVLWKMAKKSEPNWISPWGNGRPGWHIECSAINNYYFGKNIDIHGGGIDLLFPHHENENSQSNCYHESTTYSKYWMHVGSMFFKNQKMSKSKDNFIYLKNTLTENDPESIRFLMLLTHYKRPIYFKEGKSLNMAHFSLKKLYQSLYNTNFYSIKVETTLNFKKIGEFFKKEFYDAMNDDFNTPKALSTLFSLSKNINICIQKKNFVHANYLAKLLKRLGNLLGILYKDPYEFLHIKKICVSEKKIQVLVKKRNMSRILKNWKRSDAIRDKLKKLNILIEDR